MSLFESTKQRALRIDLDHHKRPEPLARAKWILAIVAALASVTYAAYIYAPGSGGQAQLSPGHVADVHAAFNNRCSECHADFHSVRGDAWALNKGDFNAQSGEWTSDAKCIVCHAAPAHHANVKKDEQHWIATCASCHQDHKGAKVSLTRIDDANCARCHVRLPEMIGEPVLKKPEIARVITFAGDLHPDFRSIAAGDPGKIQFNHALHMRPGLTKTGDGRVLSKYEDLPPDYLAHAIEGWDAAKPQAGAVQLQCASCHESSSTDDRLAFSSEKEKTTRDTAHFAPIQFDRHCQACHALKIGREESDVVPHGLKASELKQSIYAFLLQKSNAEPTTGLQEYENRLLGKPRKELAGAALVDDADARLSGIRTHLATTCTKCHSYADGENPFSGDVLPANIPQFWFQHGRFNHASHRAMDCAHCHGQATTATKSNAVMIPNKNTCVECHSPAGSVEATSDLARQFAGARSDCVECHTYHGANDPQLHPRVRRMP